MSSSHFSSSNIAQIVELNITVEPTLAAAAMHMSASDELFKMNRKLVTFSLVGLSATLEIYDTNITRI